jgi:hypothetical protein
MVWASPDHLDALTGLRELGRSSVSKRTSSGDAFLQRRTSPTWLAAPRESGRSVPGNEANGDGVTSVCLTNIETQGV